jgi:long-chain acyl-CoA synthetase
MEPTTERPAEREAQAPAYKPRFDNLVSMSLASFEKYGPRPLWGVRKAQGWEWVTYSDFAKLVDGARGGLAGLGVGKTDRVAVISNNRLEWAVGAYATYGLGATYVPMYESQLDKDWKHILLDSGAKVALVANAETKKRIENLRKELPALAHLVCFEDDSWTKLLAAKPVPVVVPSSKDIATFIYTSGTTGNPKGVRLSHWNLACNMSAALDAFPLTGNDRSLAFLPWAHVFGGCIEVDCMMCLGASSAIVESTDKLLDYLGEVRPTMMFAVPRIWNRIHGGVLKQMAERPKAIRQLFETAMAARSKQKKGGSLTILERIALPVAERLIFSKIVGRFGGRLRFAVSGAAALSPEVGEFIDNLGVLVIEGYGMTESSGAATANTPSARRIGSVGKPLPGVTVKLDKTAPGAEGDVGEVLMYGHCVMDGYHNLPEETAKTVGADGGLRSGDLGRIDSDGFLFITGRVKELYKLETGKYVAPAPLEETVALSPFISQAFIYGSDKPYNVALIVPDMAALKKWASEHGVTDLLKDERVKKLIAEEIAKHSTEWKGYEKIRDFVLLGEEFSTGNDMLTPTLKVKRRNVLKRYGGELDALYQQKSKSAPKA